MFLVVVNNFQIFLIFRSSKRVEETNNKSASLSLLNWNFSLPYEFSLKLFHLVFPKRQCWLGPQSISFFGHVKKLVSNQIWRKGFTNSGNKYKFVSWSWLLLILNWSSEYDIVWPSGSRWTRTDGIQGTDSCASKCWNDIFACP